MARRRRHSREFKLAAVARMEAASDVAGLAAELGIDRGLLYKWSRAFRAGGSAALRRPGEHASASDFPAGDEGGSAALCGVPVPFGPAGTAELERKVARQALELDFFRAALQHFAGHCRRSGGSGGTESTP